MIRVADLLLRYPTSDRRWHRHPVRFRWRQRASWSIASSARGCASHACRQRRAPHWANCCCRRRPTIRSIWVADCRPQPDDIAAPALRALAADPDVGVMLLYLTSMPFFEARTRTLAQSRAGQRQAGAGGDAARPGRPTKPRAVLRELAARISIPLEDLLAALRGLFDYHRMAATSRMRRSGPADLPTSLPPLERPAAACRRVRHSGCRAPSRARHANRPSRPPR